MSRTLALLFLFACSPSALAKEKHLVIIGDSLTEGYGVSREAAYPALLENKIREVKPGWKVINSGVSGSTSASAVGRVKWILKQKPHLVLLALGANDGLRGQSVMNLAKNLSEAIQLLKDNQVKVILVGMKMPPNYGEKYRKEFDAVFPRVAKAKKVKLIPFLLEGVAGKRELNQADGIHPNAEGHKVMSKLIFKSIRDEL